MDSDLIFTPAISLPLPPIWASVYFEVSSDAVLSYQPAATRYDLEGVHQMLYTVTD